MRVLDEIDLKIKFLESQGKDASNLISERGILNTINISREKMIPKFVEALGLYDLQYSDIQQKIA